MLIESNYLLMGNEPIATPVNMVVVSSINDFTFVDYFKNRFTCHKKNITISLTVTLYQLFFYITTKMF